GAENHDRVPQAEEATQALRLPLRILLAGSAHAAGPVAVRGVMR
ncbi:MAG: hypothetical protein QOE72_2162, partial [Chloroflexota bacterium]|nr:hypothetical protein [Chloroflexota bacterium]